MPTPTLFDSDRPGRHTGGSFVAVAGIQPGRPDPSDSIEHGPTHSSVGTGGRQPAHPAQSPHLDDTLLAAFVVHGEVLRQLVAARIGVRP